LEKKNIEERSATVTSNRSNRMHCRRGLLYLADADVDLTEAETDTDLTITLSYTVSVSSFVKYPTIRRWKASASWRLFR